MIGFSCILATRSLSALVVATATPARNGLTVQHIAFEIIEKKQVLDRADSHLYLSAFLQNENDVVN